MWSFPGERSSSSFFKVRCAALQLRMFHNHLISFTLTLAYVVGWQDYFSEGKNIYISFLKVEARKIQLFDLDCQKKKKSIPDASHLKSLKLALTKRTPRSLVNHCLGGCRITEPRRAVQLHPA